MNLLIIPLNLKFLIHRKSIAAISITHTYSLIASIAHGRITLNNHFYGVSDITRIIYYYALRDNPTYSDECIPDNI